jgi:hypothetical protein
VACEAILRAEDVPARSGSKLTTAPDIQIRSGHWKERCGDREESAVDQYRTLTETAFES